LALGDQYLLARITQKSVQQLQLKVGDKVFAQIKSVALLSQTVVPENT
jgi:molybdate transport system ATP-binding protein